MQAPIKYELVAQPMKTKAAATMSKEAYRLSGAMHRSARRAFPMQGPCKPQDPRSFPSRVAESAPWLDHLDPLPPSHVSGPWRCPLCWLPYGVVLADAAVAD